MPCKVAVASDDGKHVNEGLFEAKKFLIFRVQEGSFSFVGTRLNPFAFRKETYGAGDITALSDCSVLIVGHIDARQAVSLCKRGVRTFIGAGSIGKTILELSRLGRIG